jgi:hypothetical protein
MTTGSEPMLPHPTDDSPMISSVQTRAIADARGAYLAGNLRALHEHMTAEQDQRFSTVILDQAAGVLRLMLTEFNLDAPSGNPPLQALADLMADPRPERTHAVQNSFFEAEREPDVLATGDAYPISFASLRSISSVVMPYYLLVRGNTVLLAERWLWAIFANAAQRLREGNRPSTTWWAAAGVTPQQINVLVERWLVEAAWAVLTGKQVPSFDDPESFSGGAIPLLG